MNASKTNVNKKTNDEPTVDVNNEQHNPIKQNDSTDVSLSLYQKYHVLSKEFQFHDYFDMGKEQTLSQDKERYKVLHDILILFNQGVDNIVNTYEEFFKNIPLSVNNRNKTKRILIETRNQNYRLAHLIDILYKQSKPCSCSLICNICTDISAVMNYISELYKTINDLQENKSLVESTNIIECFDSKTNFFTLYLSAVGLKVYLEEFIGYSLMD